MSGLPGAFATTLATGRFGAAGPGFVAVLDFDRSGETFGRLPVAVAVRFASGALDVLAGLARTTAGFNAACPTALPPTFLAAISAAFPAGILPGAAFAAAAFPVAVALTRADAFPRPAPSLPPAGRPADDVRLGFARRFAFAMRPRYLLIKRDVNGAPSFQRSREHPRRPRAPHLDGPLPPLTMVQVMTLPSVTSVTAQEADAQTDVLAFVTFEEDFPESTDPLLRQVDMALGGNLRQAAADERFRGKPGQSLVLHTGGALPAAKRLVLIGAGSRASFAPAEAQHALAKLVRLASGVGARSLTLRSTWQGSGPEDEVAWLEGAARGALLGAYRFEKYLGEDSRRPSPLVSVRIARSSAVTASRAETALARGARVATAVANARDLVNEPAGALTPAALARVATDRAKALGVEATVLGPAECRARGMALFLAVSQGSAEEPRFIHLAWRPPSLAAAEKPFKRVVLIGKGVTFDSGGLSLKTNEGMLGMKADMAGAAAVINAAMVAAQEKLPVEVHALCACTENMPSGTSYKLGDVIRSMSGKTVEITNTDAEGRLTLADAMTYALELQPDAILDFATLTGACMVALGPYTAGVMTNDERLSEAWFAAARVAGEDMWPLPLPTRLKKQLKSEIADLRNTGERWGGALIAGLFLKEFVGSVPWLHVDIAGPATADKEWGVFGKGGTGFGVSSIIEYLRGIGRASAG